MAKSFYTDGVGNQQTLTNSQDEKVIIYDTLADAQSDLSNLEEGQIIGTKGPFSQMTLVDTVQSGNMNAVTSNAVANAGFLTSNDIVDEVTVNNMNSVSSNAVASLLNTNLDDATVVDISSQLTKYLGLTTVHAIRKNNVVQLYLYGDYTGSPSYSTQILASGLPQKYRPMTAEIGSSFAVVSYVSTSPYVVSTRLAIGVDGAIRLNETAMSNGAKITFTITYICA